MVDGDRIRVVRVPMSDITKIIFRGDFGFIVYLNDSVDKETEKEEIEKLKKNCEDYIFKI